MDLFSMEYVLGALTLGAVFFFLQILMDFNRKREEIRPQMLEALRASSEHQEEIDKVERLIEEAQKEEAVLQKQMDDLDAREEELKARLPLQDEDDKSQKK